MYLTRHNASTGPRWAVDGKLLPAGVTLSTLLTLPDESLPSLLAELATEKEASGELLAPLDAQQEVWAAASPICAAATRARPNLRPRPTYMRRSTTPSARRSSSNSWAGALSATVSRCGYALTPPGMCPSRSCAS